MLTLHISINDRGLKSHFLVECPEEEGRHECQLQGGIEWHNFHNMPIVVWVRKNADPMFQWKDEFVDSDDELDWREFD